MDVTFVHTLGVCIGWGLILKHEMITGIARQPSWRPSLPNTKGPIGRLLFCAQPCKVHGVSVGFQPIHELQQGSHRGIRFIVNPLRQRDANKALFSHPKCEFLSSLPIRYILLENSVLDVEKGVRVVVIIPRSVVHMLTYVILTQWSRDTLLVASFVDVTFVYAK